MYCDEIGWQKAADLMVRRQIEARGIEDPRVCAAMRSVPRHLFVPEIAVGAAYEDHPLSIGYGQTISQPYMVARVTELLCLPDGGSVLEVGAGSGYQVAVLAAMGMRVIGLERIEALALAARKRLEALGLAGEIHVVDGRFGWLPGAPYDGIVVSAAAKEVEPVWMEQLSGTGALVVPLVGPFGGERLLVRRKNGSLYKDEWYDFCRYVPLLAGVEPGASVLKTSEEPE
jgi:protein-L-isoaspartate(D-aspartate) O-methyltransferase